MSFSIALLTFFAVFSLPPIARRAPFRSARDRAAVAAGVFFILAGALHFVEPAQYDKMIPFLPWPRVATYLSGAVEMAAGLGLFFRQIRRPSAIVLVLLLLAVLPANIYVAHSGVEIEALPFPRWYFILRVPFQLFYLAWVAWAGALLVSSPVTPPERLSR